MVMSDKIECPKCSHEHTPVGTHEDDAGEFTCEECEFVFLVEIEYDPSYLSSCVVHEYEEEPRTLPGPAGTTGADREYRVCKLCGHVQFLPET